MMARKIPANDVPAAPQTTTLAVRAIQALFQLSYSPAARGAGGFPAASQGKDARTGFGFPATGG
jgi:hypothetical protein